MKILLISHSSLLKGPRQFRQIKIIKKNPHYTLDCVGSEPSGLEDNYYKLRSYSFYIDAIRVILLKFGFYKLYFWDRFKRKLYRKIKNNKYDLIILHEIRIAPLAFAISKGTPVILDAHEYSPKNFDDNLLWRFFIKKYYTKLCEKYINNFDKIITVSPGIVDEYKRVFDIDPILITNATEYVENIRPTAIDSKRIKILHHGIASSSRKLELIIEMMEFLDERYELNLMLVSSTYRDFYLKKLVKLAKGKNVKFLLPVNKTELISFSNKFDIGIHFVPPTNFNLKYGLGNKFFEYIQSRLVVAIGPDIEMSKYVKKYDLGIISPTWSPEDLAQSIKNTNLEELVFYKNQCQKYAKELSSINNEKEIEKIINKYFKI
tara:strand:- start:16146 stop:17273 length:1128 start_codon:yes stop_codon:yes gene_type:complete